MKNWIIFSLGAALAACGGGGSNNTTTTSTPTSFTVTATANTGGTITPSPANVIDGETTTLTVTADEGFNIENVSGCSGSLAGNIYTTGAIVANCSVTASFFPVVAVSENRVAYIAYDQAVTDSDELYAVGSDGSNPVKLSADFVAGGNVSEFIWSGDGSRVIYLADQEANGRFELYSVLPDGSSLVKLNEELLDGSGISDFTLSPTGNVIAYLANQSTNNKTELYTVSIDGTNNVKVNGNLVSGGNVTEFIWSPNGEQLAFVSDLKVDEIFELYSVNSDGSNHQNINPDLATNEFIHKYEWSPLSKYLSYQIIDRSDISVTDLVQNKTLYSFDIVTGNNVAVIPASQIAAVKWSDDDSHIAAAGIDGLTGLDLINGGYGLIQVNSANGDSLISLTTNISATERPKQFEFLANSNNVAILSNAGSFITTFYIISSIDGSVLDTVTAAGIGGAFSEGTLNGATFFPDAYYDAIHYEPFTYSADGRYIVINDFALSIYDTQEDILIELAPLTYSHYQSHWIEEDNTLLYSLDSNTYQPETYERTFINPIVVNPLGAIINDIDQLLGGDDSADRALNPLLSGEGSITFLRWISGSQGALMRVDTNGQNINIVANTSSNVEINDYQLMNDNNTVIYTQDCTIVIITCPDSSLQGVDLDGNNGIKINPSIFSSTTGIKQFSLQP